MNRPHFKLVVRFESSDRGPLILDDVSPDITVADLIEQILRLAGLDGVGWRLAYRGRILDANTSLRDCMLPFSETIELILSRTPTPGKSKKSSPGEVSETMQNPDGTFTESMDSMLSEFPSLPPSAPRRSKSSDESRSRSPAPSASRSRGPALPSPAMRDEMPRTGGGGRGGFGGSQGARKVDSRRATVRYYNRMNPQRLYPLLVLITREMVEKVVKKGTSQQSSGPFQVDLRSPIEIEPILPGCDCYPPRITARLGDEDFTATFRVVPRMLGKVEGASVVVRQDHQPLAEIPLESKVSQRTWVVISGLLTFALPGLSAILKHFGVDFSSQKEQGFSVYLSMAQVMFDRISPLTLTLVFGAITAVVWWLTRPQARDVFFDIKTVGPAEKLRQIEAIQKSDAIQARADLVELMAAYPDYRPARVLSAELYFKAKEFLAALNEFGLAFVMGTGTAYEYHMAAYSASQIKHTGPALSLLLTAQEVLGPAGMTGTMLYNMGCYHTRLGDHEAAMACLTRAVAAGFVAGDVYRNDVDLVPLAERPDFQQLLAGLRA